MTGLSTETLKSATVKAAGKVMAQHQIANLVIEYAFPQLIPKSDELFQRYIRQYETFDIAFTERLTELEQENARLKKCVEMTKSYEPFRTWTNSDEPITQPPIKLVYNGRC